MNVDVADAFAPGTWEFTPEVVREFDTHVHQSVPHYDLFQSAVAELSDWLAPDGSTIADLGAATGESFARILARHPERNFHLVAYDKSAAMLDACVQKVAPVPVETHVGRIERNLPPPSKAVDLTICLFTLQFIKPRDRMALLRQARANSLGGSAILLAEKLRVADSRWAEIATEASWDYKVERGISSDSIRAKARALRGVLQPGTDTALVSALEAAGWTGVTCLLRWHQWALFGAFV